MKKTVLLLVATVLAFGSAGAQTVTYQGKNITAGDALTSTTKHDKIIAKVQPAIVKAAAKNGVVGDPNSPQPVDPNNLTGKENPTGYMAAVDTIITKATTALHKVPPQSSLDMGVMAAADQQLTATLAESFKTSQARAKLITQQASRYVRNGDGTLTDVKTGLQWELKTGTPGGSPDPNSPHNVNNTYAWTATGIDPDGPLFTDFLARLNGLTGGACFAGHCDWRVPTIDELVSISTSPNGAPDYVCPGSGSPCIDPAFAPTALPPAELTFFYVSSTTVAPLPGPNALVLFYDFYLGGFVDILPKGYANWVVRAVRNP